MVECKLATNPQIRREIVGQMFDYASRLWKMDIKDFADRWRKRINEDLFHNETDDGTSVREALALNLAEARFRIVLAVDMINPPLKRMVEYLNFMSGQGTSVVAVEYSRLAQGNIEILMPRIYGQELAEAEAPPVAGEQVVWDGEAYRAWIQTNDHTCSDKFDMIIKEAAAANLPFLGSKAKLPAGHFEIVDGQGRRLGTVSLFYFSSQGTSVEFDFTRLSRMPATELPPDSVLSAFLQQLARIPGFLEMAENLRSSGFASRRPNLPLADLSDDAIRMAVSALRTLIS